MGTLLACPFCREMFAKDETARCPSCDVELAPLESLPPSHDVLSDPSLLEEPVAPEDVTLPITHAGHGRAMLIVLAIGGLVLFFLPWVEMRRPELVSISGYDLARTRAGWLWGGAVGWFILLPLVLTRRSLYQMQGVRIICATFCAMTLLEVLMILALPPDAARHTSVDFSWGWALYASGLMSVLGIYFSVRFGAPSRAERASAAGGGAEPRRRASVPPKRRGRTLH